ncbi:MAG: hypothetical protein KGZ39_05580 [Simkania sp.]|nr:hypothetical protein [Simkania sp.]
MLNKYELEKVLKSGASNVEAATIFDCGVRTIVRARKTFGLDRGFISHGNHILSDVQNEILTACLLGDGYINFSSRGHSRFGFGQAKRRRKYVEFINELLKPLSVTPFFETRLDPRVKSGKSESWRFYTHADHQFTDLREKWYNPEKKVPSWLKLSPLIFSHWFLQDGCNSPEKRALTLATDAFSRADVEFLQERLRTDLELVSTIQGSKQFHLAIGAYECEKALSMIRQYNNFRCFRYKNRFIKKKNPNLGASKLNKSIAEQIRIKWKNGVKPPLLAEEYDVGVVSIYNILSYRTYAVTST